MSLFAESRCFGVHVGAGDDASMASASGDDASMASASGVFVGGGVARPAATSAFSFAGDGDECEFSLEVASFSDAGRRAGDGGARRPGFGSLSRSAWTSIANPNPNGFPRRFVRRWSGLRSRAPPEVEVDVSRAGDLGAAVSGADRDALSAITGPCPACSSVSAMPGAVFEANCAEFAGHDLGGEQLLSWTALHRDWLELVERCCRKAGCDVAAVEVVAPEADDDDHPTMEDGKRPLKVAAFRLD